MKWLYALIFLLSSSFFVQVHAKPGYLCTAQGTYSSCTDMGTGYTSCVDQVATGMGAGHTKAEASIMAEVQCSDHITNMVIINNMGGGGSQKMPCRTVSCEYYDNIDGAMKAQQNPNGGTQTQPKVQADPNCLQLQNTVCQFCGESTPMCQFARTQMPINDGTVCMQSLNQLNTFAQTVNAQGQQGLMYKNQFCQGQTNQAQPQNGQTPFQTNPPQQQMGQQQPGQACQEIVTTFCQICGQSSPSCQSLLRLLPNSNESDCAQQLPQIRQMAQQLQSLQSQNPQAYQQTLQSICNIYE